MHILDQFTQLVMLWDLVSLANIQFCPAFSRFPMNYCLTLQVSILVCSQKKANGKLGRSCFFILPLIKGAYQLIPIKYDIGF